MTKKSLVCTYLIKNLTPAKTLQKHMQCMSMYCHRMFFAPSHIICLLYLLYERSPTSLQQQISEKQTWVFVELTKVFRQANRPRMNCDYNMCALISWTGSNNTSEAILTSIQVSPAKYTYLSG